MAVTQKDLVIIGGGPAGLSASIYAQRSLLDAVTLEAEAIGGQTILTSEIDNYPGLPHTDGFSLSDAMRAQAQELGAQIVLDSVRSLSRNQQGLFEVRTDGGADYLARAVIVSSGARPRRAGFFGEAEFSGHGVSYCATCDGMFYRNKQVFVIGGGNSAVEEALFLTRFASKVTLVVRKDHLRAQAALLRELEANEKVEVLFQTTVESVEGDALLSRITLRDLKGGALSNLDFEPGGFGVFVMVGREPQTTLVRELVDLDENGYVLTDERMATRTSGLYVAGDCRRKSLRQIITAASDGAIAATSAATYLGHPLEG